MAGNSEIGCFVKRIEKLQTRNWLLENAVYPYSRSSATTVFGSRMIDFLIFSVNELLFC